jgi:biopolymer transport protein ExbD
MPQFKRKIPQFNATSSADIAFILLLFFLLTGSLDPKSGIYRRLSPAETEVKLKEKRNIEKRNLLTFTIDGKNRILLEDKPLDLSAVRDVAKTFISNPNNLEYLPEKTTSEVPTLGLVPISDKAIIQLIFSRNANYQTYISVLSELTTAYNDLRSELANEKFHKPFDELTEEEQTALRKVYPQQISETELQGKEAEDE